MTRLMTPPRPLDRFGPWVQWLVMAMAVFWLLGVALRITERVAYDEGDALRDLHVTLDRMADDGTIDAPARPADDAAAALPPEIRFWTRAVGEAPDCGSGEVAAAGCAMRPGTRIFLCRNRKAVTEETDTIRWREVLDGAPTPPVFGLMTIHPDRTDPQDFVLLMGAQCGA